MTKEQIWDGFTQLFPDYVDKVEKYEKIGSKSIKLTLNATVPDTEEHKTLIFLYNDIWDWTFGTKVWRKKPRVIGKENKNENA